MGHEIENMRIRFYGIQGSGSTFPATHEAAVLQDSTEYELLKSVFEDISKHLNGENKLDCSLEEYLGGPVNRKTLLKYKKKFRINPPRIYGGWTTCIHIETGDGNDIVLDCGSGFRNCAQDLQLKWGKKKERHLHIFGSHSHSDHTEGFDQAAVCFDPRNNIHIYGNQRFLYSLDSYLGIFSKFVRDDVIGVQTPINFSIMPAKFQGTEICKVKEHDNKKKISWGIHDISQPVVIGNTRITALNAYHPAPCLAYKIEYGAKKFIYCTDHELRHGDDPDDQQQKESLKAEALIVQHAMDADVLYRDGQYLRAEYDGLTGIGSSTPVPRIDWGHSCLEDVEKMALECRVKRTFIGHHDPNREWPERRWIDEALARGSKNRREKIELACAETTIDL